MGAQKVKWNLRQTGSRECLLLSRPIGGCLCDFITLGNTGGRLLIHSAAYVTLLMQEVAVNMIQLQELGLHEEILGNYCIATFDQSLYPHQNLWEDFQCLCVIFLNTR